MKKLKLIAILVFIIPNIFAQKNNVQSANNCLKYNDLESAKKYIDLAYENPITSNDLKMWYFRGRTYWAIYSDKSKRNIDTLAIEKGTKSFINCIKVEEKKFYYGDSARYYLINCALGCFDQGVHYYRKNNYKKAIELYSLILDVIPFDKDKDLIRNNVSEKIIYLYSFYASKALKDYEKAKVYLQKLIDLNYNDPKIYIEMSKILLEEKDTAEALGYIERGRSIFDDNKELILKEMEIYEMQGKSDLLMEKLTEAVELDPENSILYFVRGNLYEKKSNLTEAEKDYLKSVEFNPDYFDALYNLGALYFNKGVEHISIANDIKDLTKYQAEKAKADEKFKQALSYLENAHEINPEDRNTMISLKILYYRMQIMDKHDEIKALLEGK